MAKRIKGRKDNIYDEKVIKNILDMYMEECQKAISAGESVHLTKVGAIIEKNKDVEFIAFKKYYQRRGLSVNTDF